LIFGQHALIHANICDGPNHQMVKTAPATMTVPIATHWKVDTRLFCCACRLLSFADASGKGGLSVTLEAIERSSAGKRDFGVLTAMLRLLLPETSTSGCSRILCVTHTL
jgi:hypothetical protein